MEISVSKKRGPKEKVLSDPIAEATRQRANESARRYKAKKRALEKQTDDAFLLSLPPDLIEDKDGIRPIDARRYIKCFHSGWIGADDELKYVKIMTGLSLKQIFIMQQRTGLLPVPAVSQRSAEKDQKLREITGNIY